MNISLFHPATQRSAARFLALAAATAITALSGQVAFAQSGLVSEYASNAGTSTTTNGSSAFGPGTQVVSASSVPTAADLPPRQLAPGAISQAVGTAKDPISGSHLASIAQVNYGCQSCNQTSCNGGCGNSCSSGTCGSSSCGNPYCGSGRPLANPCGTACDPYWYVIIEGLYMDRRGASRFSLTRNTFIEDFQFDWAPRITFGTVPNCTNGYEFSYTGEFNFDRTNNIKSSSGDLNTVLYDGDGEPNPNVQNDNNFDAANLDPLFDSNNQFHFYRTRYWSAEINKTCVGWDVIKLLAGARYVSVKEDLLYGGIKDSNNSYANIVSSTENDLLGGQIGIDLLYPVARHFYTDVRARGGAYLNIADSDVRFVNQGEAVVRTPGNDNQLSGLFELGGGLRFELGQVLSIRAGGEMWYLMGIASAPNQIRAGVTPLWGIPIDVKEDVFFYGGTITAEVKF